MTEPVCHYCEKGEKMAAIAVEVARLSASIVYLFREQSHPGRLIVAYNEHVGDVADLTDAQRDAFFADVARASRALHSAYRPDKVNYGAYGDQMRHLHFHLVPKYKDDFEWGGVFAMNPQRVFLDEAGYAEAVERIRKEL